MIKGTGIIDSGFAGRGLRIDENIYMANLPPSAHGLEAEMLYSGYEDLRNSNAAGGSSDDRHNNNRKGVDHEV